MSGISAQYVDGLEIMIAELREQVEKLTQERDIKEHCIVQLEAEDLRAKDQLVALAEQTEKMRKALTKWRYMDSSYNWRCGYCGNEEGGEHKEGCVLSLPDLASPVLNRIRVEGMRMAADICFEPGVDSWFECDDAIRARAAIDALGE